MDILNEVAGTTPVNLDDLVEERPIPAAPEASIRNRASLTALLSDKPDQMVEQYQAMIQEGMSGKDDTRQMIKNKADQRDAPLTQQSIMQILADRNASDAQKQAAINGINSSKYKDTAYQVAMSAAQEPQKKENIEQEDVRIRAAEIFGEIHDYQKEKQALQNKFGASLDGEASSVVASIAESILPFATNKMAATTLKKIAEELKMDVSGKKFFALPGSAVEAIRETLSTLPPNEQLKAQEKILDIIDKNSGIYFTSDNDFNKYNLAKTIFEEGGYSSFDKWVDNGVGLLDVIGLGGTAKSLAKGIKSLTMPSKTAVRGVADTTAAVSPANLIRDVNPDKARGMYQMVVQSSSDEAAKALYGTSRTDAIASQVLPQPKVVDGSIEAKLIDPDRKVVEAVEDTGAIYITEMEKAAATSHVINDIKNAVGITVHDNLATGSFDGNTIKVGAIYGDANGGFARAETAIDQVKFSLKDYGIKDTELQVMKRVDGEYVPVKLEDVKGVDGDYLVKLDLEHNINPSIIGEMEHLDVKRNWSDRIPVFRTKKSGTLANTLLDNASMLHARITGGAVVAADKAARVDKLLLELHNDFAERFTKLPKARQDKLYDYVKEANFKGIEEDALQLTARGFQSDEINALTSWRKAWDTHYWLENFDVVRTLDIQGYKLLDHANARLFAKPVSKNQNIARAYDPDLDKVVSLSKQEMDDLYTQGGSYASLRRPASFDGTQVEHIIVKNNQSSFLRGIRNTDQVLDYRKGYFQVQYKAPKYVVKVERDAQTGRVINERAVAVAGDSKEADHIAKRLTSQTGEEHSFRGDVKEMRPDTDFYWDLQNASGRSSQRHRGKRLESSNAPISYDSQYVLDPIESAIRAARSLSGRVATRDFLETSKQRALQQYGEYFPMGKYGEPEWVENSNSLVSQGRMTDSKLADARTTVEYLNYLQHGYENALDTGFKGIMNALANFTSGTSSKLERTFLAAGDIKPTELGKNTVFQAYIATNPLRQFLIQTHQSIRLWGYNASYFASGKFIAEASPFLTWKAQQKLGTAKQLSGKEKEIADFVEGSGMLDAVDKSNLVRGALTDMAEMSSPIKRNVGKLLALPRKAGFDLGEQGNLLAHLLTVRDKFVQRGLDVKDKAVRDEIYSQARAMSYDMNVAGDMPYNQNWASMFMQFFQVPHKAITSVTTNRRLPVADKLKLATTDLVLFGVPGSALLANLVGKDSLPENPVAREAVMFGVESASINYILSDIAGKDVNIDFSSLAPYNLDGWAKMADAALSGGMQDMLAASPAANIFFKDGSKVQDAIGRMLRYTGVYDPYEGHTPEDVYSVMSGVAEISSGWSNYLKAKTIYETGKVVDKQGNPMNTNAGAMEAVAKLFGFGTQEEALTYYLSTRLREGTQAHKDEVLKWTKGYLRILSREEKLTTQDDEYYIKVLGAAKNIWKDDFTALGIINSELGKMAPDSKTKLIKQILEYSKLPKGTTSLNEMRALNILNDEDLNKAIKLHQDIENSKPAKEK